MSAHAARQSREPLTAAPQALVIMGVSGCGKSTAGAIIAEVLGWHFEDADAYHPPTNVAKMAAGQPLTDEDRWPWLLALQRLLADHAARGAPVVLACSALRPAYRRVLEGRTPQEALALDPSAPQEQQHTTIGYVLLDPHVQLLESRLQRRAADGRHFMPPQLLASQLATLEYDEAELLLHITSDMPVVTHGLDGAVECSVGEEQGEGGETLDRSSKGSVAAGSGFPAAEQIAAMVLQQLRAAGD